MPSFGQNLSRREQFHSEQNEHEHSYRRRRADCHRKSRHSRAGGEWRRTRGPRTGKTKALEAGAELLQSEAPLRSVHAHVCGFHFYNGEPQRQVIAHHYCSHRGEDFLQCVIYDSDKPNARLIGIEYIISEELFRTLPEEEKKFWHSHVYEVKSGSLIAPGLPNIAENELMKQLIGTYGKTWHTWQVDRGDQLPLGIPQLMMGFTADGQANPQMVADRDKGYGISSDEKKKARAEIAAPPIQPGADAWQKGKIIQLEPKMIAPATQQ